MFKKIATLLIVSIVIISCSGSSDGPSGTTDNFDREAMLSNLANNIIVPAFADFKTKIEGLKSSAETFSQTPDQTNLDALRQAWFNAYKTWQHVAMFEIGKAEELQFVYFFNIYPLTVADVETNIANGTYDLNHVNNHDAQGFPALDYLLYGIGANDTEILVKYTTDANAANYKKYITDIVAKMDEIIEAIVNDWNGAYKNSFITSSGNTATSSLNKFVNDYIFYYEKRLRANKFGIPAGNFSTNSLPEKVEAFYKQNISKELALEALTAVQNVFTGKAYNGSTTGESFKTYLENLGRNDLVTLITNQFNTAKAQINTLDNNFYQQINTDNNQMTMAYDELQKAVVLLKVDMLQAFNVSVDYVDADGD
ncbi:putative lipoprotein [Tenacibaculum adriaticum]|uniref:Putative lipoprotein n=1 Tax=Tenacibaculum adriaticum TaxID=413713 RepID=A0A5S5DUS8_9FLAO|nr:imelysin family protein [Tenacibaculum adriaticum]TYP98786.1 putative lipoprotein [Tenacibaculum adriaticum]